MGLIKFELTKEHLDLLKNLEWDYDMFKSDQEDWVYPKLREGSELGNGHVYEMLSLILDGPEKVTDPNNTISFRIDEEKKKKFDKLLLELPMALDIVLSTQSFEVGIYKTRTHHKEWKKI